ncbi:MAG: hypothetical protein KBT21_02710 [Treponema sp.]|nr:hypothetical protein [Candidatus Treponema merdequi]
MKKLLAILVVLATVSASVFANVELSESYFITPTGFFNQDLKFSANEKVNGDKKGYSGSSEGSAEYQSWAGSETRAAFYFGSPCSFLDLGMNLGFSVNWFDSITIKQKVKNTNTDTVTEDWSYKFNGSGFDLDFLIGPAVRFNFGPRHSVVINPAFGFGVLSMSDGKISGNENSKTEIFGFSIDLALDVGYRFWVLNTNGFHLGIAAGCNFVFPVVAFVAQDEKIKKNGQWVGSGRTELSPFVGGVKPQIYLGVALNFGDRSVEKR